MKDLIMSLFNLKEDSIRSLSFSKDNQDTITAYIETVPQEKECPFCGAPLLLNGKGRPRIITHSILVQHNCYLHWTPQRFICSDHDCRKSVSERNPFAFPGFSISYATIRQIMFDLRDPALTYKNIAAKNNVSVTQVQHYFDSYVHPPTVHLPENLGIDEIRSDMAKYGSSYLCVLVDNDKRQLVDILPSRSKSELFKYFEAFPKTERDKVRFVTIDMWEPYKDVVTTLFRHCEVAVDPFHVVKHLVDGFTDLRLSVMRQVEYGSPAYYLLKKWNWMFTTADVNLDNEKVMNHVFNRYMNRRDLLEEMLALDGNLSVAYYLMKDYQEFNKTCPPEEAKAQLDCLIQKFSAAEIPQYREFLQLLHHWHDEIVNSFHRPTGRKQSNALTESINSQIRTYLAVSKGNVNFARFRRRILYCLNDHTFYSCTQFLTSLKQKSNPRGPYRKNSK